MPTQVSEQQRDVGCRSARAAVYLPGCPGGAAVASEHVRDLRPRFQQHCLLQLAELASRQAQLRLLTLQC